jgi:hypothetical protein
LKALSAAGAVGEPSRRWRLVSQSAGETDGSQTLRWREMDSNHRYRIKNNPFWLPPFGPAIRLPQQQSGSLCRGPMVRIHLPPAESPIANLFEPVSGPPSCAVDRGPTRFSRRTALRRRQNAAPAPWPQVENQTSGPNSTSTGVGVLTSVLNLSFPFASWTRKTAMVSVF